MIPNARRAQVVSILTMLLTFFALTRIAESQPLKTTLKINNWRRNRLQTEPERVQMYANNNPIRGTSAAQSRQSGAHADANDVLAYDLHMQQLMEQLVELSRDENLHLPMPEANTAAGAKFVVKCFDNLRSRYRNVDVADEPEEDPHDISNSDSKLNASEQRLYDEITNSKKDKLNSKTSPATAKLNSNETQANVGESLVGMETTQQPSSNSYSKEFQLTEKGEKKIVKITTLVEQQFNFEGGRRSNETSLETVPHQNASDVVQEPRERYFEAQDGELRSYDRVGAKDSKEVILSPDDKIGMIKVDERNGEERNLNENDVIMTTRSNHVSLENLNKLNALKAARPAGPIEKSTESPTISNQLLMEDKENVAPPRATVDQRWSTDDGMTQHILIISDTSNHVSKRQEYSDKVKMQALGSSPTTNSSNKDLQQRHRQKFTIKNMTERKSDNDNEEEDVSTSNADVDSDDDIDDDDAMTTMSSTVAAMHSTLVNEQTATEADNDGNDCDKENEKDKEMDIVVVDNNDDDNDVDSVDASTRVNNVKNIVTEARVKEMSNGSTNKASTNGGDMTLNMSHKRNGLNQSRGTSTLQSRQAHESIQREAKEDGHEEDEANMKFAKNAKQKVGISRYRNVNVRNDESISQDNVTVDEAVSPDIFPLSYMPHLSDYVSVQSKFLTRHDKRTPNEVTTHPKKPAMPKGEADIVWVLGQSLRERERQRQRQRQDSTPFAGAPRMTEVNSLPEIETTNWWHMLPYTEIRSFLNTIHA